MFKLGSHQECSDCLFREIHNARWSADEYTEQLYNGVVHDVQMIVISKASKVPSPRAGAAVGRGRIHPCLLDLFSKMPVLTHIPIDGLCDALVIIDLTDRDNRGIQAGQVILDTFKIDKQRRGQDELRKDLKTQVPRYRRLTMKFPGPGLVNDNLVLGTDTCLGEMRVSPKTGVLYRDNGRTLLRGHAENSKS
ncbi:unnamed protein product [Penicillium pancosmium]